MHNGKKKRLKSSLAVLLTTLLLFSSLPLIGLPTLAAGEETKSDETNTLEAARLDFFDDTSAGAQELGELETIIIKDEPHIIEQSCESLSDMHEGETAADGDFLSQDAGDVVHTQGPFSIESERSFGVRVESSSYYQMPATLMAQGEHSNIWLVDDEAYHEAAGTDHTQACKLDDMNAVTAQNIANIIDGIYTRMTDEDTGFAAHAHKKMRTRYSDPTYVGDIDNDGMVNYVFYPMSHFGVAGFFSSSDFHNFPSNARSSMLDVLHISIDGILGSNPLYYYGTLAHEFQHMLFYMYFGQYASTTNGNFSWINESLSDLAKIYYLQPGAELIVSGRTSAAAQNPYAGLTDTYSDFVTFNAYKGYGVGYLLSALMYKKTGGHYASDIYEYFRTTYPPSSTTSGSSANAGKFSGKRMEETWGNVVAALGIGSGGAASFAQMYWMFMENLASDGGTIHDTAVDIPTLKFYSGTESDANVWSLRNVSSFQLASGGSIAL